MRSRVSDSGLLACQPEKWMITVCMYGPGPGNVLGQTRNTIDQETLGNCTTDTDNLGRSIYSAPTSS